MIKRFITLLFAVIMVFSISSCKKEEATNGLIGKWDCTRTTIDSIVGMGEISISITNVWSISDSRIVIFDDEKDSKQEYSYTYNKPYVSMEFMGDEHTITEYEITSQSKDAMVWVIPDSEYKTTLTFKRIN